MRREIRQLVLYDEIAERIYKPFASSSAQLSLSLSSPSTIRKLALRRLLLQSFNLSDAAITRKFYCYCYRIRILVRNIALSALPSFFVRRHRPGS
jgi:hypothetical protein